MRRSNFSEAQVAFILRQAEEGAPVGEVCRKAGISEATFYVWRKKYAGLMPSGDVARTPPPRTPFTPPSPSRSSPARWRGPARAPGPRPGRTAAADILLSQPCTPTP